MRFGTAALVALFLLPGTASWAADVPAVSKIDSVTVFPSGAEIARTAKVSLEKGEHTIVFQDVAAEAVPSSIRVEGKATGKLDIGSVDSRRLFVPQSDAANAEIERRRIEDDIQRLKDEKAVYQAQVQAAETQKTLIANLAQLPARPAPPSGAAEAPENWGAILSTIASGTQNAQRSLVDAQSRIRELDRQIKELQKKLSALPPARIRRTEIKVFVSAEAALEADITVLYQVPNASWVALYDARLTSGNKTSPAALKLTRRASISQRTGESWDNVALTLSTTRPTAGAAAPELKTVTVDFEPDFLPRPMAAPAPEATGRSLAPARRKMVQKADEADALADEKKVKMAVRPKQAKVVAAPFQALFDVPGRLSIPNTGEAKRVELLTDTIEPSLIVKTVPKETAKAYLYAKLTLPKDSTPVLPGTVSLFRGWHLRRHQQGTNPDHPAKTMSLASASTTSSG